MQNDQQIAKIECTLTGIRFSGDNNFIIGIFNNENGEFGGLGSMFRPEIGMDYLLFGEWSKHPQFGSQVKFVRYETVQPEDTDGIYKYLVRIAKWVGPSTGEKLVDKYGDDTLNVLRNILYHCKLTNSQLELYKSYAQSAKDELTKLVRRDGFAKVQIHVLATLTRLKQICCHPAIFAKETKEVGDSAKYEMLLELVQNLIDANHKTVICSQYTKMLAIMRDDFEQKGIKFSYLDGTTKNRLQIVKEFNENKEKTIFLVSLKAGGTGLNITGADSVIHYDMWWNPAVESQATDRVHRIGQKNSVSSYKLVTVNTIEEKIVEMQNRKRGLVKKIVSSDDEAISKLTWEEVLELLQT